MALTKKDLENIGKVVDEKISANNTTLKSEIAGETKKTMNSEIGKLRSEIADDTKKTVHTEISLLRLEMNQRFDATDKKIDTVHKDLSDKIDQVITMETEDIQMIYSDISKIKKHIAIK